ncbi:MAG: TMEM165/GDT1 family protein [candidate division WOR-3 bacterium]
MPWKNFFLIFFSLFLAELGDKTQLAVIGFTTSQKSPFFVFLASTAALAFSTLLAVLFGSLLLRIIPIRILHLIAGILFFIAGFFAFSQGLFGQR